MPTLRRYVYTQIRGWGIAEGPLENAEPFKTTRRNVQAVAFEECARAHEVESLTSGQKHGHLVVALLYRELAKRLRDLG